MLRCCRCAPWSSVSRAAIAPSRLARRWVASVADEEDADAGEALASEALLGSEAAADVFGNYEAFKPWFKLDKSFFSDALPREASRPGTKTQRKHAARQLVSNADTADRIVRAWNLHKRKKLQILELYAGDGVLTRALLDQGHRVLAIEDQAVFQRSGELDALAKRYSSLEVQHGFDPTRIHVWQRLAADRPDLARKSWDEESDVAVVVHISPNPAAYQFLAFCAMMAASRSIFYAFGRVTIYALAPTYHAIRVCPSAVPDPPLSPMHFTLENALEPRVADIDLQTEPGLHYRRLRSKTKRKLEPMSALVLPARRKPFFGGDDWQTLRYVVSGLHSRGALPWMQQLNAIGHGAGNAIPKELEAAGVHIPPDLLVRHLTIEQMVAITHAFLRWPFHPDVRSREETALTSQPIASTYGREDFHSETTAADR